MAKTFELYGERLTLRSTKYQKGGGLAVEVVDEDGAPYARLSVNLEEEQPSPGHFWLKDWSENEPVAKAALEAKVIALTGRMARTGFVAAKEAKLL